MDQIALTRPVVHDREALLDFADAMKEHAQLTEREVGRLRKAPGNRELVASLFRAVHNIKGDAALCRFPTATAVVHPIEGLLARLRAGEIVFSEMLAEIVLLAIDRLELATTATVGGQTLDYLNLVTLVGGLETLAETAPAALDAACARVIEATTGFRPATAQPTLGSAGPPATVRQDLAADIGFFRTLALQFDAHSPMMKGRSVRVPRLALETNEMAGRPIAPAQLEAAALIHDIGMLLLPDASWLKDGRLTLEEKRAMREHPAYAAGLLERMPPWREAARIVREHHEMPDGNGYPQGLAGDAICAGAKLLAIVDAFESVILKQAHRGRSRSFLRAAAEVNANPNQFAPEWIGPFNRVIRGLLERS